MTTKFSMQRDINGYNGFGLQFSDTNYSATIAANTATSLTVPGNSTTTKFLAVFSFTPGGSVYVANNETAAVPAGSSFASTTSVLNPTARVCNTGDVLSFITADVADDIQVSFYGLQ